MLRHAHDAVLRVMHLCVRSERGGDQTRQGSPKGRRAGNPNQGALCSSDESCMCLVFLR
jgi:hypothetical protein